ncbi:hypothetical protein Tco_0543286 [Tanacetum coccineum]
MRTRSQARRRRQPQVRQTSVESSNLEKPDNPPIVTMADNRTMAQLLEAPTEGYEDAIVIPEITANNFEIKHGLLNLVQNKQFFGNDKEDPHAHIRYFNKITSTMKDRTGMPHHGFSELHQLDTFYNALNENDQDSLNSDAGHTVCQKTDFERYVTANDAVVEKHAKTSFLLPGSGTLPGNTVYQPKRKILKGYHYRTPKTIQPSGVQIQSRNPILSPMLLPVVAPVIAQSYKHQFHFAIKKKLMKGTRKNFTGALMLHGLNLLSDFKNLNWKQRKNLSELARTTFEWRTGSAGLLHANALAFLGCELYSHAYSVWKDLALPELTPTCMTLELADRSITEPIGMLKTVRLMVGRKVPISADFVSCDFEQTPGTLNFSGDVS